MFKGRYRLLALVKKFKIWHDKLVVFVNWVECEMDCDDEESVWWGGLADCNDGVISGLITAIVWPMLMEEKLSTSFVSLLAKRYFRKERTFHIIDH